MFFSEQKVFCNTCGKEFQTKFQSYDGHVCSKKCYREFQWRKTLATMGQPYQPQKCGCVEGPSSQCQYTKYIHSSHNSVVEISCTCDCH